MQLSKRLLAVSDMVTSGHRLADVGTDHGYIPLWLIEQNRIPKAIAMDINQGPLLRAMENIKMHRLANQIETRLSDGLAALHAEEADSVVIAGMGGGLVMKILKEGEEVLKTVSELILQPQSDIDRVRNFLQQEGYLITKENMILEDGKFYSMMRVVHGEMKKLSAVEALYGPCLLKDRNDCLKLYLEKEETNYRKIQENLISNGTEKSRERLEEIRQSLDLVEQARNYGEENK